MSIFFEIAKKYFLKYAGFSHSEIIHQDSLLNFLIIFSRLSGLTWFTIHSRMACPSGVSTEL